MSAFSDFGVPGLILCRPIDAYSRPTMYAAFEKLQYIGCISHYVPGKGYYLENDDLTIGEILIVCRLINQAGNISTDQKIHLLHKLYRKMSRWDRTVYRDMIFGNADCGELP